MELRGVLFDFDGTLIDSGPGIKRTVAMTARELGLPEPDDAAMRRFIGPPLEHSFMRAYGMSAEEARRASTTYRAILAREDAYKEACFYPGVLDLVRDLRKEGKKVAIASAKRTAMIEKTLEYFGCADLFDGVFGAPSTGETADKPRNTKDALFFIGGPPAILVGDSDYDAEAARQAGIPLAAVLWGYGFANAEAAEAYRPEYIVPTVADLRKILL